ncbi:MAG: hypothetical protein OXF79_10500 [Chloroflexi bacterium]|nr:hypothetical protein [Chloroflexota bacterium]
MLMYSTKQGSERRRLDIEDGVLALNPLAEDPEPANRLGSGAGMGTGVRIAFHGDGREWTIVMDEREAATLSHYMRRLWASRLAKHISAFEEFSVVNREDRERMEMLAELAGEDVPQIPAGS